MKKDEKAIQKLMQYGFAQDLAGKLVNHGYNISKLRIATKADLSRYFSDDEIKEIKEKSSRQPIPDDIFSRLIGECDWKCCICWNIDSLPPIIIHHIEKYANTQDNGYDNLVVLCPTHHAIAHMKSEIAERPLPPELIQSKKKEFILAISEAKAGRRVLPGRENASNVPAAQSDEQALEILRRFLDRAAMRQPFRIEGNMSDFYKELMNIVRAVNTGILKTRDGDTLPPMKSRHDFTNEHWRTELDIIAKRFDELKTRFEMAVRTGDLVIEKDAMFYTFKDDEFPQKIDELRNVIVLRLNKVLIEAGLKELPVVGLSFE